ncbi:MAG: AbrB/MazE/SpoVT family DNA-binding domain-containing protein [Clostridia bacterium]|nr:AbrB/MazE/SpoVT family DNA-binding domain-containing protein [Clostridia bacterium]
MNYGRVVLPIDFRHKLGITEKDTVNIYMKSCYIVIEKSELNN